MTRIMRLSTASVLALTMLAGPVAAPLAVMAQTAPQADDVIINMRGADIKDVAEQVARITGRTLVLDPQVQGPVNVVSATPLSRAGVWELFLSVLRTSGFAAVRSGNVWRILPQASVVQGGATETGAAQSNQQIITRTIRLRNLPSDQAVRAMRPLVSSFGGLEALTDPNAIVVTDYAENVRRVQQLAASLDAGGNSFDSVALQYASATEVAEAIGNLLGSDAGGPRVTSDLRSNTVLIRGDAADLAQARSIARALDMPGGATPVTRVVRLKNSDAESVAAILAGLLGGEAAATNPVSQSLRSGGLASLSSANTNGLPGLLGGSNPLAGGSQGGLGSSLTPLQGGNSQGEARPGGFNLQDATIQPSPELNAIVMRGSPTTVAMLEDLITQLDLRRAQVKIEVAIVEITGALGEQIGVQLAAGGAVPADGVAGGTSFSPAGTPVGTVLSALGFPTGRLLGEGLSLAVGQRDEFGILLQALGSNASANLLSTPSVTVLDNEPAEFVAGQNVPFRTGSFATDGNTLSPFTTIAREDVGLTLRVIPRVHDGDVVRLEVSQELSSLVNSAVPGAADLVTNRRSIQTSVLADDGETVVLGGLVTDDRQTLENRVPGLSSLPGIGGLFRSRNDTQTRRTLFIFLKPTILRDPATIRRDAQESYDRLRAAEPIPRQPGQPRDPAITVDPRLQPDVGQLF